MAARRARSVEPEEDDDSPDDTASGRNGAAVRAPRRWRLLPDGLTLHRWQQDCLPLWLEHGHGTVKVATGGGKTLFALAAAQALQNEREAELRLIIVVPTIPLMFQWRDELAAGNLPSETIGLMGGGQDLQPARHLKVLIAVINSARDRLTSFVKRSRWQGPLMLVVDECHRANAEQARRIFDVNARYTLGLSATPEQDADASDVPADQAYENSPVGQGLGPIIYEFSLRQSYDAGLLTPFEVWHVGLPLTAEEGVQHHKLSREISELRKDLQRRHRSSRSSQGFLAWCQTQAKKGGEAAGDAHRFIGLANQRKRLLYRAEARLSVTVGTLADAMTDPDGRAIVFHESIDEVEAIYLQALAAGLPAVLEHSKLQDSLRSESIDAFRRGIARVIVSAKSLVEGFNVPSADLGIIAASSGSVRQRIQSLGRLLRRKPGGRAARVLILFVRDTEDEAIYEKADWEGIVGAERNRYFEYTVGDEPRPIADCLKESGTPPRTYRPPSWEVDTTLLEPGDRYPGQTDGLVLKLDQSDNLRTEDGRLVPVGPDTVAAIRERNDHGRAVRTPAGHLIVRLDGTGSSQPDWRYIGRAPEPEAEAEQSIRLRVKSSSGRRVLALSDKRGERFALGRDNGASAAAGDARQRLLEWIAELERDRGVRVSDLHWNGKNRYWLELEGERIFLPEDLPALEFRD